MPSSCCSADARLLLYYGHGGHATLARFRRVVLQARHHAPADVRALAAGGTEPLAYLSLSEDTGPPAPWQRSERNVEWGGRYVAVAHPGWQRSVLEQAAAALESGYAGLFLDTLEPPGHPGQDGPALVELVGALRRLAGGAHLMANRGYWLKQELAPLVDAFLFEAFSTTWQEGYRVLPHNDLLENVALLHELQATGREVFALDYANRQPLAAFARSRALTHQLPLQVTDRQLTCLPEPAPSGAPSA